MEYLRIVLGLISKHKLRLKIPKGEFAKDEVGPLGHIVSVRRVDANPEKIEAIRNAPVLHDGASLRSLLGLDSYY